MTAVDLKGWYQRFPNHTVGGSLYAVPAEYRLEAARLLHRNRCRIHADLIVGPNGHQGVSWAELAAVRAALPSARIDLHMILLDRSGVEDEVVAIDIAQTLHLDSITMTGEQINRHRIRLDRLRSFGIGVYEELRPEHDEPAADRIDGALVMFIPPGTKQAADPRQLDKVARLAAFLPVAVDGGITHSLAQQCHDRGAGYLISGRDLFMVDATHRDPSVTQERRPA